jgi:rhodanese-related sulfurtransferase
MTAGPTYTEAGRDAGDGPAEHLGTAGAPALADRGAGAAFSVDDLLADARAGLRRVGPVEAAAARRGGAVLVDIRPHAQRVREGEIPGALVVERNVLEWRFDPASQARLPIAAYDLEVIVVCSEGYTSSLAAYALQQLGIHRATDLAGGYRGWHAAGLPTVPGGTPAVP